MYGSVKITPGKLLLMKTAPNENTPCENLFLWKPIPVRICNAQKFLKFQQISSSIK